MKAKLRLKLWKDDDDKRIVCMKIYEQEGINETISSNVRSESCPYLAEFEVFLRGSVTKLDFLTVSRIFDIEQEASDYIKKVVGWLDEVFAKPQPPKRGDLVMVYENEKYPYFEETIFLADLGEMAITRFSCVSEGYESAFESGERYHTTNWKFMKLIPKSNFDAETGVYFFDGEL